MSYLMKTGRRRLVTGLTTLAVTVMCLAVFSFLESDSDAHPKCASEIAAVRSARSAVQSASITLQKANKRYASAQHNLAQCEAAHRREHEGDDDG